MDTRKNIVDLEAFREMLHISPRVPGQSSAELPFEENILEFLRFLGHSAQIKTLTDVNVNKLYQPWRSFAPVINKCLTRKSSGFDSLRPNKVNWHYVMDDILFSTIKVVSIHQNTQQYGAILPIELTTEDIGNTKAYKEYYVCATREAPPKPKVSAKRKRGASASSTTPLTPIATPTPITTVVAAPRLTAAAKGKQQARATSPTDPSDVERTKAEQLKIVLKRSRQETHISQQGGPSTDEGTGSKPGVPDVPSDDSEEEISWNSFDDKDVDDQTKGSDDNEGEKSDERDDDDDQDKAEKVNDDDDDEEEISKIDEQEDTKSGGYDEETGSDQESEEEETKEKEEESFDPIPRTPEDSEDDGNGEEDPGLRISEEERIHEEEEADELYCDVDIYQGRELQVSQVIDDSYVTLTPIHSDGQESSSMSSFMTSLLNLIIDPGMESIFTTASSSVAPLPSPTSIMTPSIMTTTTASQPLIPPTLILTDLSEMELKKVLIDKMEGNKEDERMMMIRKDPQLDQTGGLRDKKKVGSMHQPALHLNQLPGVQAGAEDQPIVQTSQHPEWSSQPRKPLTPDRDWNKTLPAVQGNAQSWISELAKQTDALSSFNELLDTPIDFSNFIMNRLGVNALTLELLAGPTYELMRGSYYGHIKWIEDLVPHTMWIQEPLNYDKHALWGVSHWGRKRQQFYEFAVNRESAIDVYSKRRIIVVTDLKIVEWHNYKYLDWISRVEDLQLGVESYQKRLNLTKPDTLMRIDKLYKFSNEMLNDVRNALDDHLNGIRMQYLPTTIWRKGAWKGSLVEDSMRETFGCYKGQYDSSYAAPIFTEEKSEKLGRVPTEMELILEHTQQGISYEVSFSLSIDEIVTHWFTLIVMSALRRSDNENMLSLVILILRKVSLMLEILSRRFFLKLNLSDHMSILTDLQGTLKGKWRYLILAKPPIHNHVLIPNYQDFKIQDFRYSDGFECFQAIKIGRYEHVSPMSLKHKMDEITR
nr:hypothetical protein [Tanacetum cinerariifolium]